MEDEFYVYYGTWQYSNAGVGPFVDHAKKYVEGMMYIPVTKTISVYNKNIFFTFVDELMIVFIEELDRIKKFYAAATLQGFQGFSKGRRSGIFLQRKHDINLISATETLIPKHKSQISQDLLVGYDEIGSLKKVKIVAHVPKGERVVGVLNEENQRILFLGFASY